MGLVVTGGSTGDDRKFLSAQKAKLRENGLIDQVEFHEDFEEQGLRDYFKKVSLVSVPVRNGEAFGIYLLECMVSGIPVVQPPLGAFPEIVGLTGGGVIYGENKPGALAGSLASLLRDPERLEKLSHAGAAGVKEHFHIDIQARRMIGIYEKAIHAYAEA